MSKIVVEFPCDTLRFLLAYGVQTAHQGVQLPLGGLQFPLRLPPRGFSIQVVDTETYIVGRHFEQRDFFVLKHSRFFRIDRHRAADCAVFTDREGGGSAKALLDVAKSQGPASTFHVGFILGPRINAGGRIGRADLGARLLSTDDPEEARALAEELDSLNASRKEVEREVTEAAIAHIETESNQSDAPMLLVAHDDWHPGVIGIVAGRLREKYRKPVVVVGVDRAANVGKGSGRSQPGVNLGRAIQAAYEEGLLLAGGGHAMAAGLSVRPDTIPELRAFLCERLALESEIATAEDALEVDALVTTRGCDRALWQDFQRMAPFGPGNVEPLFALADIRVERPMALRGGHVRCSLSDGSGAKLKAVAWRVEGSETGRRLMAEGGAIHVVGRLKPDDWQGRQGVEFEIEDVADPRRT